LRRFPQTDPREEISVKCFTYLNYGGNCRQAFEFYAKHLGGKITMLMMFGEQPDPSNAPPGSKDAILHGRIELGDTTILGADIPSYQPMQSVYLTLIVDSDAEAERLYALLREGGETFMPMEETFFAHRIAMLRDKFGTSWMLIHERPMP
jgi:PhnB protein